MGVQMLIQIGMRCEPEWLCNSIGWVIGGILIAAAIALYKLINREYRRNKEGKNRRFPIKLSQNDFVKSKKKRSK
jgi:hypothetical protein